MKIQHPLIHRTAGLVAASLVRGWMSTLDYRVAYYDPAVDPVKPECRGRKIYIFWHEYILCPLYLRGHCNLAMLLSQHRDAEILSRVARHLGFEFVRGSSRRGGQRALRELERLGASTNLTITPDGPQGPRRQLKEGPIYLASRTQLPLVLLGIGYENPWRAGSWDRFAVPRPFSRVRSVVSPELKIPPQLDREGIAHYRSHVERLLNRLTLESEAWARSGTRKIDESPVDRRRAPREKHRIDSAHRLAGPHAIATQDAQLRPEHLI